jgi:hypothetical protein
VPGLSTCEAGRDGPRDPRRSERDFSLPTVVPELVSI